VHSWKGSARIFFQQIERDRDFLSEQLQMDASPEKIIQWFLEPNGCTEANRDYANALGVLLGYGKSNSLFFTKRCELGTYLKKAPFVSLLPQNPCKGPTPRQRTLFEPDEVVYRAKSPSPNYAFEDLEEEWKWIVQHTNHEQQEVTAPYLYELPAFIEKKCQETTALRKKYQRVRDKLAALFCNRSFLEIVIEKANEKDTNVTNITN